jgi:hypothetical protein
MVDLRSSLLLNEHSEDGLSAYHDRPLGLVLFRINLVYCQAFAGILI